MKKKKKTQTKLKHKLYISKSKKGSNLRGRKQVRKLLRVQRAHNTEKVRLEGMVSDLSKVRNGMKKKIQKQTKELEFKDAQLSVGSNRQVRSEEQIHILTIAMESAADGIFIIDAKKADFPVIYANQSFQKMSGYAAREVFGQKYFSLFGTDADKRVIYEIENTMRLGRAFHGEMFNFNKDGKKYWDLLRLTPVRDAYGTVTHYIGIQTDVTSMRDKELQIDEQREELLHVTRVGKLAEFVSSLAHEINQPLTAILSYAEAAQRMLSSKSVNQTAELQDIIKFIIQDDQRAAEVIQRLRSLLKKSRPEIKPLDINTLVDETVLLMSTDAIVRNVFFKLDLDRGLPIVHGDRIQLQQVLLNLISNSFDAMESNQGSREIDITTSPKGTDAVMVAVKDTGSGITAQNMPKLFTHFFTSKPDGLGMGLSISRSIVESHGGKLYVENNPDRGVTFYFTIPTVKKSA